MTRAAKQDDVVMIPVPRSAINVVEAPPLMVSQRTCLKLFSVSKEDYLRMVAKGAFPVKAEGQLRLALYADVEAYLRSGMTTQARAKAVDKSPPRRTLDPRAALADAGFRPPRRS